jgi:hypothetical protein
MVQPARKSYDIEILRNPCAQNSLLLHRCSAVHNPQRTADYVYRLHITPPFTSVTSLASESFRARLWAGFSGEVGV